MIKAFLTMKQVKLIGKKEFTVATLSLNDETFMVYIVFFVNSNLGLEVCLFQRVYIAFLKANETIIFIFSKYTDFVDIFFKDLATKFPKHIGINDHTIDMFKG